jgi:hypothetical protein
VCSCTHLSTEGGRGGGSTLSRSSAAPVVMRPNTISSATRPIIMLYYIILYYIILYYELTAARPFHLPHGQEHEWEIRARTQCLPPLSLSLSLPAYTYIHTYIHTYIYARVVPSDKFREASFLVSQLRTSPWAAAAPRTT